MAKAAAVTISASWYEGEGGSLRGGSNFEGETFTKYKIQNLK